ncbi:hypothetical protein H0H87_011464 [Tephrocybe sp. NHM501043]|nr:hypothetical protein H0H87_011464 [Tephrocybe sp. NHM501043]
MFKFDFALDDADVDLELSSHLANALTVSQPPANIESTASVNEDPCTEISITTLLQSLPNVLSYSPITIPVLNQALKTEENLKLARRDLFDARYQLITQESAEKSTREDALAFVQEPSDLLPGVYEGGLKTWECSVDLAGYLAGLRPQLDPRGKRIIEVGCGTGVPSMFVLREILSSPKEEAVETEIHLQDYNVSVLELLSFPNIILTWFTSPAAASFRESQPPPEEEEEGGGGAKPSPSNADPGDLFVTPSLRAAFLASLEAYKIRLRFFSGSWRSFPIAPYDVVLTSETIYRSESLTPLLALLKGAAEQGKSCLCLVAAKVLYFGVGGGVSEFVERVKEQSGVVDTVWEGETGVGRRIMSVRWESSL